MTLALMPIPDRATQKLDLVALLRERGQLSPTEAYEVLSKKWRLTSREKDQMRGKDPLYQHEIRWSKQHLVIEGAISRPATTGRGNWRLANANSKLAKNPPGGPTGSEPDALTDVAESGADLISVSKTVREALIEARLGQGLFRRQLLHYWNGCAVTGCQRLEALRASHIRPWRDSSNRQRLDKFNGLLLLGTLDALFDCGLISFSEQGELMQASVLTNKESRYLGLESGMRLRRMDQQHLPYLQWHRRRLFRK
jgi:hypothetical protein